MVLVSWMHAHQVLLGCPQFSRGWLAIDRDHRHRDGQGRWKGTRDLRQSGSQAHPIRPGYMHLLRASLVTYLSRARSNMPNQVNYLYYSNQVLPWGLSSQM